MKYPGDDITQTGQQALPVILVADDSEEMLQLVQRALRKKFRVLTAHNGAEAVNRFQSETPDVVLLDVEMPEMNGFEACRKIQHLAGSRFIPVIFITGLNDVRSLKEGLQSGAVDYLTKPFQVEELLIRLQAVLRTKQLYDQLRFANAVIEKERDTIAQIQKALLVKQPPEIPGFRFFCDYQPSSKAGGDYYDFIPIDEEHLGLWVSDVSGHGTPAAVIMAMERIVLRTYLSRIKSPAETLEQLNRILCENIQTGDFITAFYGVVHLPTGEMHYASAGHNPPLMAHFKTGGGSIPLTVDKGFPLMISPHNPMEERSVTLLPGSKLVLYTDGIVEARNAQRVPFGFERLQKVIREKGAGLNAAGLGRILKEAVNGFTGDQPFVDDYTLVILEVT